MQNHKLIKSWVIQLVSIVLYTKYLVTPDHVSAVQGHVYKSQVAFDPISFIINVVIMMALSMAVGALTAKKPSSPRHSPPAGIEQFSIPTADEGRAIQVLFGKRYIAGPNVVWYGDLRSEPVIIRA